MDQDERDEKLGRTIFSIAWFLFVIKFLAVATLVSLVFVYILGRPLWLASLIAVGAFIIYRLIWRLIWKFLDWASRQ